MLLESDYSLRYKYTLSDNWWRKKSGDSHSRALLDEPAVKQLSQLMGDDTVSTGNASQYMLEESSVENGADLL